MKPEGLMLGKNPTKTTFEQTLKAALRWNPRRREITQDLQALMATVDASHLRGLRQEHADAIRSADPAAGYKYLDVALYTLQKLLLARELGLEGGPSRRVLDIGTGGGHFPFVCRFFGHRVVGIDIENALYEGIAACLGVQRTIVRVEPQTPLPDLGERFDLITACDVTFNDKDDRDGRRVYWTTVEWQFFLNDLVANHLQYPGTLYLKLNKEWQKGAFGSDRLSFNREVLAMAARNGAAINRRHGTIKLTFTSRREIR
jgi:SAM-dependent methyltransferase